MKKHLGLMLVGGLVAAALCAPVLAEADDAAVQHASSRRAWTLPPQPPAAPPAAPAVEAPVAPPAAPAMEAPPAPPAAASATTPPPDAPPAPPSAIQTAPAPPAAAATPAPPALPQAASTPKPARPTKTPTPAPAPEPASAPQAPEPPPGPGRERGEPDPVNVRFDVTVSYQAGAAAPVKRVASIVVSNGSGAGPIRRASLRSGNNIPVPTTTFAVARSEDGKETPTAAKPLTAFNYRSVGFNVDVDQALVLSGNRVRAFLNIESSGVDDKASNATGAPSFPTFSQVLALYLESGKPVIVAQSSDVVDNVERKQTVEVKATILR